MSGIRQSNMVGRVLGTTNTEEINRREAKRCASRRGKRPSRPKLPGWATRNTGSQPPA